MKRERDWLDYIQTASSVGQNIQLSGIKGVLKELQGIEERKQFDERQLAWFRKCLFKLEDDFDTISGSHVSGDPKIRLWAALKIQHCLQGLERFSAVGYEDKDRHRSLGRRVNSLKTEAEKDLPPDVAADIAKAFDYESSLVGIEEGIKYKKAVEPVQKAREALEAKTNELAKNSSVGAAVFGMKRSTHFVGWICSIIILLVAIAISPASTGDTEDGAWVLSAMFALFGVIGFLGFGLAALFGGPFSAHLQRQEAVNKAKAELAGLEANPPNEDNLFLFKATGLDQKLSAMELDKILSERKEFIGRVMGANGNTEG